jgi:hypothetical protein
LRCRVIVVSMTTQGQNNDTSSNVATNVDFLQRRE